MKIRGGAATSSILALSSHREAGVVSGLFFLLETAGIRAAVNRFSVPELYPSQIRVNSQSQANRPEMWSLFRVHFP